LLKKGGRLSGRILKKVEISRKARSRSGRNLTTATKLAGSDGCSGLESEF
jgi:hypothetical protein